MVIPSFNVTDCSFTNFTTPSSIGALGILMGSDSNGDYSFTENTFINFTGAYAAIYFEMDFISFNFSNNSFSNMVSANDGGVYFYIFHLLINV
jgi:hypothetical protein